MPKSKYDRYSLKNNLLKKVILRIDLEGATNMDSIVAEMKNSPIGSVFCRYQMRMRPNMAINNVKSSAPSEVTDGPYHVFSEYNLSKDKVELSVSTNYICLTINCEEYKSIDPFKALISDVLSMILHSDHFIIAKRVGIRKISGYEVPVSDKGKDIFDVFESRAFQSYIFNSNVGNVLQSDCHVSYSETSDVFKVNIPNHNVEVIYKRMIRHVFDPIEHRLLRQAILDLDAYTSDRFPYVIKEKFGESLDSVIDAINSMLFELYKLSVTTEYLKNNANV